MSGKEKGLGVLRGGGRCVCVGISGVSFVKRPISFSLPYPFLFTSGVFTHISS